MVLKLLHNNVGIDWLNDHAEDHQWETKKRCQVCDHLGKYGSMLTGTIQGHMQAMPLCGLNVRREINDMAP